MNSSFLLEFDRFLTLALNGSECLWLDNFAFLATKTLIWLPLIIALLFVTFRTCSWRGALLVVLGAALCVIIADQVASGICKPLFGRLRPTHDPLLAPLIDTVRGYRGGKYGFFSSHASNTFAVATLFTLLFKRRGVAFALFSWALLNCWTRVYLGVHFVSDLLVGVLFGLLTGYLVAKLLLKVECRLHDGIGTRISKFHDHIIGISFLCTVLGIALCAVLQTCSNSLLS